MFPKRKGRLEVESFFTTKPTETSGKVSWSLPCFPLEKYPYPSRGPNIGDFFSSLPCLGHSGTVTISRINTSGLRPHTLVLSSRRAAAIFVREIGGKARDAELTNPPADAENASRPLTFVKYKAALGLWVLWQINLQKDYWFSDLDFDVE